MLRDHHNYFPIWCQRAPLRLLIALSLASAAPAAARAASVIQPPPLLQPPPPARLEASDFLQRLARMHVGGTLSLNWRNVGPEKPGFETQVQNEVYLADMYFGVDGPFVDGVPVQVEAHLPTGGKGTMILNQLNFGYKKIDDWLFQFGKFVVPYGRYNELYRPDQFLTVTRPLLYASPDTLDLVIRLNSPRPPVSLGYTDIGARASYYPPVNEVFVPEEVTFFVVNGLGESTNRLRTFPNIDFLGVPNIPGNGTTIDFGHQDNNLADNNNNKAFGGRMVFSLGDLRFPWPIPEGASDLKGVNMGLSAMDGQYDLEDTLTYQMYAADWSFDYLGFDFSGEYEYSATQFKDPLLNSNGTVAAPTQFARDFEVDQGYFVQASAPILRAPRLGQRLTGVAVFNQLWRRGPIQDLLLNATIDGTTYPSVNGLRSDSYRATTRMDKYTVGLNYQLSDHFTFKFDYSYWVMGRAATRSVTSIGNLDIYQGAFSMVMAF